MRNDPFFTTLAVLSALAACGGLASARMPAQVAISGRVEKSGARPPAGTRATLRLDDDQAHLHAALEVICAEACSFQGQVPPGTYRASLDGAFAQDGHRALLAERLEVRRATVGLRLAVQDAVTISGALAERPGCPERLPAVTFKRLADGDDFGAAVSCSAGQAPGFAASLEPGEYDVRVELPDGRATTAHFLQLRGDAVDVPLGILLPAAELAQR